MSRTDEIRQWRSLGWNITETKDSIHHCVHYFRLIECVLVCVWSYYVFEWKGLWVENQYFVIIYSISCHPGKLSPQQEHKGVLDAALFHTMKVTSGCRTTKSKQMPIKIPLNISFCAVAKKESLTALKLHVGGFFISTFILLIEVWDQ